MPNHQLHFIEQLDCPDANFGLIAALSTAKEPDFTKGLAITAAS